MLSIVAGWAQMLAGDLDGLESCLDDADAALEAGTHDEDLAATWADTEDLRTAPATILVYRASLAQARGDVAGTVRHARAALDLAGPEDHFVRGGAGGFLGLAAWAAGDIDEALATFSEAVRSLHAAGNLVDELDATVVLADMWVAAGRPSRARRLYEQALATATGDGEPYPRATADLHVGLAELDRELDDLASAEAHLETARVLAERGSITENRHRWPVAMAPGARGPRRPRGGDAAARGGRGAVPARLLPRRATDRGDAGRGSRSPPATWSSAATWARERGLGADDDPDYLHEYEHLTLARLLLAQAPRRATAPTGRERRPRSRPSTRCSAGCTTRPPTPDATAACWRSGCCRPSPTTPAATGTTALGVLGQALTDTPEPESHVRLYLDEGAPMLDLLRDAAAEHQRRGSPRAGAGLGPSAARAARSRRPTAPVPQQSLADPLSQREVEVLRLLDSELTGPQIAGELYVSLNTLRTHTKRIFTKLDVKTRAAAVRRAHEQGLL